MTPVFLFLGLVLLLSIASALGWTADSRDPDFTLAGFFSRARPAPPSPRADNVHAQGPS
jgi:hypothetical protein